MRYFRPIQTDRLVQKFGENLACAKAVDGKLTRPIQVLSGGYPNTCPVGSIKLYPALGLKGHNGVDSKCYRLEPIYHCANFEGWTRDASDLDGGFGVDVISKDPIQPCKEPGCNEFHHVKVRYWHIAKSFLPTGTMTKMGDKVALGDNTGASSGDHVHWTPKYCTAGGSALHKDNGYYGSFDPGPEYTNKFVLDEVNDLLKVENPAIPETELKKEELTNQQLTNKIILQIQIILETLANYILKVAGFK